MEKGNWYVLVMQDFLTKWPLMFTMPDQKTTRIVRLLEDESHPPIPPSSRTQSLECSTLQSFQIHILAGEGSRVEPVIGTSPPESKVQSTLTHASILVRNVKSPACEEERRQGLCEIFQEDLDLPNDLP